MSVMSALINPVDGSNIRALMDRIHGRFAADVSLAADGRIAFAIEIADDIDPTIVTDAMSQEPDVAAIELVAAWYDDENTIGIKTGDQNG